MSSLGGGSERFCWMGDDSWPGDYIEPSPAGGLEPNPWINGDADYQNWGINTANIVFYIGDSNPYGFVEMFPGAPPSAYNTSAGATLFAPDNTTTVAIGSQSYNVAIPARGDHRTQATISSGWACTPATCSNPMTRPRRRPGSGGARRSTACKPARLPDRGAGQQRLLL